MFKKLKQFFGFGKSEQIHETKQAPVKEWPKPSEDTEVEKILSQIKPIALKEYKFTPEAFDVFSNTLRNHQLESILSLAGQKAGQVNIPTGAGKTYIQKYLHVEDMIEKTKEGKTGIYVIAAHRLLLCSQLFDEIIELIVRCGLKTDLLYIGSGRYPFDRLNFDYSQYGFDKKDINVCQTTNREEVNASVEKALSSGHHLLIVATYHSFDALLDIERIDMCTFDEAHTTIEKRFTDNINSVIEKIDRKYFFTATRKVIGEHGGQNDFDFYGPILYEMSPRTAVEAGEIVPPRIHVVTTKHDEGLIDKKSNIGMLVETVIGSFIEHEKKVRESSCRPDEIGAKILVTSSGLDEIQSIITDDNFKNWVSSNNINVFSFSSRPGETTYNFSEGMSRESMLERMGSLSDNEKAILFHYDILTEGIDLPSITGVMLLRSTIPYTKLLQNLGRACRLQLTDRRNLYTDAIKPTQYESMVKPCSWVILPTYINDNWSTVGRIIKDLRVSYEIPIDKVELTDISNSIISDPPESVIKKDRRRKDAISELEHIFENIDLIDFDEEIMNSDDKKRHVMDYIKKVQCQ